jgi:hypothetical protein
VVSRYREHYDRHPRTPGTADKALAWVTLVLALASAIGLIFFN